MTISPWPRMLLSEHAPWLQRPGTLLLRPHRKTVIGYSGMPAYAAAACLLAKGGVEEISLDFSRLYA